MPVQSKKSLGNTTKFERGVLANAKDTFSTRNVTSRICSTYNKVIQDGRISYRGKSTRPADLKSITSADSILPKESCTMKQVERLSSGYQKPCIINLMSIYDCKLGKTTSVYDGIPKPNVVHLRLSESFTNPIFERHLKCLYMPQKKRPRRMSRGTQTLYRESSMQTLPYLPEVSNDAETLKTLELYKLPKILKGDGPPGVWEVEILERARKRWAVEKALHNKFQCAIKQARKNIAQKKKLAEHKKIIEAFEWESWLEREENIQGCQMLRFQLVLQMFEKRQRKMHSASDTRIQQRCEMIVQKRDKALKKNDIEFGREMRRLKIKHEKKPRNWRKEKISDQLGDPSSEYYAPQMRYGVNPNRRHFQLSRKAFEMRMEDLEKRAVNMKNLKCPFAKLKEWSKPKEQKAEVEQNFCSEVNLQKLYEGLKGLREQAKRQKIVPKCLIEKAENPLIEEVNISDDLVIEELDIRPDENSSVQMSEEEVQAGSSYSQDSLLEMYSQRNSQRMTVNEMLDERRREELENMIAEYEGTGIGWLMRFLSEEKSRLLEQRKLHFVTMLAQKERWRREAAEAGLRQKENEMRKIYEQIFEETETANDDVCEQYLDNIFGIDTQEQADYEAICSITDLAKVIDTDLQRWLKSFEPIQNPVNYDELRCLLRDLVFPDNIAECLSKKYERQSVIDHILDDVILGKVYDRLEPIVVARTIATEFVDRLFDTDLYVFSPDCSSECDCQHDCTCQVPEVESKAILRKLVRYSVPGRRWRTGNERVAEENVNDIVDDILGKRQDVCAYTPSTKKGLLPVRKVPSMIDLLTGSTADYEKNDTSHGSTSDTFIDTVTVIKYAKSQRKSESRKPSLVGDEKLLYEDNTTRSSSHFQLVRKLYTAGSKAESTVHPSTLKETDSNFDITLPGESTSAKQKYIYASTDEGEDELLRQVSLTSSALKDLERVSQSFLTNIINQVVKDAVPTSAEDSKSEDSIEAKKLIPVKSQIAGLKKFPSDMSEVSDSSEIQTDTGTEKVTEERDLQPSHMSTEHFEELFSKASEYEMVMYEEELNDILRDDDDEPLCQMEIDYKNAIRQLYESGKIKVIHKQRVTPTADIQDSLTDQTEKDILAELTFEYVTSVDDKTVTTHFEDVFDEAEEAQAMFEGEQEEFDDKSKVTEAAPEATMTMSEEPAEVAIEAPGAENVAHEVQEVADEPQDVGIAQELAVETNVEPVAETKEQPAVVEAEIEAPEQQPQEQPEEQVQVQPEEQAQEQPEEQPQDNQEENAPPAAE